eukprot:10797992-Alexandrium_andersonii.AAC.1
MCDCLGNGTLAPGSASVTLSGPHTGVTTQARAHRRAPCASAGALTHDRPRARAGAQQAMARRRARGYRALGPGSARATEHTRARRP